MLSTTALARRLAIGCATISPLCRPNADSEVGIATHYVSAARLPEVEKEIASVKNPDLIVHEASSTTLL
jgi:hypothetical protein